MCGGHRSDLLVGIVCELHGKSGDCLNVQAPDLAGRRIQGVVPGVGVGVGVEAESDQRVGGLGFHTVEVDQAWQGGRHVEPHPIVRVPGEGHHLRQRLLAAVIAERGDDPAHHCRIGLVTKPGPYQ